jgi:hypothetical protein
MIERLATKPDLNVDVFERLLAMRRQEEDRAARRSFNAAMSLAKGELGPVLKTHDVDFTGKSGTRTKYKHETLADVQRAIDPVFSKHGLSYRFRIAQQADQVKVICIVSHADGHSEENPLEGKVDAGGTGMSMVQALGSALTYLQRYGLRAAIGLAAAVDDDGRGAGGSSPRITEPQMAELKQLIHDSGRSQATLFKLIGVERVDDMNVDQFTRAKDVLVQARSEKRNAPGN